MKKKKRIRMNLVSEEELQQRMFERQCFVEEYVEEKSFIKDFFSFENMKSSILILTFVIATYSSCNGYVVLAWITWYLEFVFSIVFILDGVAKLTWDTWE